MSGVTVNLGHGNVAQLEPDLYEVDRALLAPPSEGWRPGAALPLPVDGIGKAGELLEAPASEGLYLFHLEPCYRHAGHYLGWAYNLRERVGQHQRGTRKASPLIRAQLAAGGQVLLARIWEGETRTTERRMKNQGGLSRHCPLCRATGRWHR